jgi:hypothetical protein
MTRISGLIICICAVLARPLWASTPASHDVAVPATPGQTVTVNWTGTSPPGVNPSSSCTLPGGDAAEDHHLINLTVPPGAYDAVDVSAKFEIAWTDDAQDLILTVEKSGEEVKSSDGAEPSETVTITNPAEGAFDAIVCAFQADADTSYSGRLTLTASPKSGVTYGCPGCQYPGMPSDPIRPRTVVAIIDSALNPYHSYYYASSPIYSVQSPSSITQEVLREVGVKPENILEVTRTGNMAADLAADAAKWATVKRGELYHFKGTNVIAISFAGKDGNGNDFPPLKPVWFAEDDPRNKNPHGTGTSSSVLTANPEAIILFVETDGDLGSNAAHEFVLRHPAVDILSTSYGIAIQGLIGVVPETRAFHETYEAVVQRGKLHFTSAGNNPGVVPLSGGAGPWWSVGVSGIEEDNYDLVRDDYTGSGQQIMSGNVADMVGDYTQQLPYCMGGDGCETSISENVPGTSFSTPRAAGLASRVLLETRRQMGHLGGIKVLADRTVMAGAEGKEISNWFLRRALEQAAWVPPVTDRSTGNYITWEATNLPVNPVAPWLQIGWGEMTTNPERASFRVPWRTWVLSAPRWTRLPGSASTRPG